jgi:hypothetical protein
LDVLALSRVQRVDAGTRSAAPGGLPILVDVAEDHWHSAGHDLCAAKTGLIQRAGQSVSFRERSRAPFHTPTSRRSMSSSWVAGARQVETPSRPPGLSTRRNSPRAQAVWKEHEAKPAQDVIKRGVRKVQLLGIHEPDPKGQAQPRRLFVGRLRHTLCEIDPDDLAQVADVLGGREQHGATTTCYVEHPLARFNADHAHHLPTEVGERSQRIVRWCETTEECPRPRLALLRPVAHHRTSLPVPESLVSPGTLNAPCSSGR